MPSIQFSADMGNFDQFLDRFGEEIIDELQKALDTVADKIVDEAKQLAPVRTGELRDSIHKAEPEDKPGQDRLSIDVVADAEHAVYVELGTSKMSAKPFLTPAFDHNQDEATTLMVNVIREHLRASR